MENVTLTETCEQGFIRIDSKPSMVSTKFHVEKGKTYYYEAKGIWKDGRADPCDADGFTIWLLAPVWFLRTHKSSPWFCLIGKVGDQMFRMGKGGKFIAERNGELFCFANDAPNHRDNNNGSVCLRISEQPL